jgi:hypothetical protein
MGNIIRKDYKYKLIKNFLTKEERLLLKNYAIVMHRNNSNRFDFDQLTNGDTYGFRDPIMDSLMLTKQKIVEKETSLKLYPTYSCWRMYTFGSDLKKHKDRPSCEISITVNIDGDGTPWPIFMENNPVDLEPGDACIYLGCEILHERKEFKGDWQAQVFLHYVDAEGPNASYKFDKRQFIV